MLTKIKTFVNWLNTDDLATEPGRPGENSISKEIREDELEQKRIEDGLRTLKRSGLALPYEVWPEFVVDVAQAFNSKHPERTSAMFNTAIYAMRVRRNHILPPNTPPEEVVHREIVWVYGIFVAVVLHHAHLSVLQLRQLFGENPQLAITADKELCIAIEDALNNLNSDNVVANVLRQALAANAAFQRGATKEEINAAAEAAKRPVSDFKEDHIEEQQEHVNIRYELAEAFLEWGLLPVSAHIQTLSDNSKFYALPAFAEFANATSNDKGELIAEFEAFTGLSQTRETLPDGSRHKGYKEVM